MIIMKVPEYNGIEKIISGGQCGADFGGLLAAETLNIPTGGWAPKNFKTHFGNNFALRERFNLKETNSSSYRPRTLKNIKDSDGTLIIASNMNSPGCLLTYHGCLQYNKPVLKIQIANGEIPELNLIIDCIQHWLSDNQIKTLNIAGNRDKNGNLHETITNTLLISVLNEQR